MSSSRVPATPHNVEQITRIAQDYEYNPAIALKYWLRTANSLVKEAEIYEREGHDEQAYLLLFRHAQLVLVNLVNHPNAKDEPNRQGLVAAEKQVKINIEKLEALKPRINKRYERHRQLMLDRESRKVKSAHSQNDSFQLRNQGLLPDPALSDAAQPLEAGENKELAVKIAQKEINRRATVRRESRQAAISPEEERIRRTGGMWGDWERALGRQDDISHRIQEVRLHIDGPSNGDPLPRQNLATRNANSTYKYPIVPQQRPFNAQTLTVPKSLSQEIDTHPPVRPAKEYIQPKITYEQPPLLPNKITSSAPPVPQKEKPAVAEAPSNQSDLNPSTFTFKPSAYLENGTPLRTVFLPPDLRNHFLALADSNTRRNLETCGILCGTLISNALFVSKLLIPEQESTSDTCETVNETAIFDYCDSEDLMVLGWIHTHPTQTCFMSSRDLHTHCGYQAMLPESIAIVCAPSKDPSWGVFRLTDPPGLKSVLGCKQTGLFHPHAESNIYTDALRPGHVFEAQGLEFETVDLRPGI
ncbi:putative endosome-associated ubiquitin isopeptidase [Talaromyces proteolyticus]|uniref:Endosome-associated ubiquitin isopeptidase n=1 Tax=Talaromyces proteolyticus TaxID=1131652 RepID=A0AAD4PVX6_9EURO|nr:putative endosome-associated ubiquitin isopeptidase [Talaromyces proteolyticus]KAH8693982.1 putative endosome-associated ubiquitin isopeptidase [Talaromyces proteolyticus]